MALSRFTLPFADVGGGIRPASGAKLFFYETGTNTLKDTFNSPDGATANSNPVIADSKGLFPDIFVSGIYKVVLKDKSDVQQYEADPVAPFALTTNNDFVKSFPDLANAIADTELADGDALNIAERIAGNGGGAMWDVVLASTVTANTYNIVACTGAPTLALVLRYADSDIADVKAFGATGDGSTTDTGAIQKALDTSVNVYFPEGVYKSGALTRNEGVRLLGDGIGRTVLEFSGTDGITITSNSDDYPVYVEHLSMHQTGAGTNVALKIDNSGQISGGVIQNRTSPRLKIENVAMRGSTSVTNDGWFAGIECIDVMHAVIDGFHFEGKYTSTADNIISEHAMKFSGAGSPVEIVVTNSWVFFANNAIRAIDCEGVFVDKCNFVAVESGVRFDPAATEPQLQISNTHINCYEVCVVATNVVDGNISNNLFFVRADAVANTSGVQISSTTYTKIAGNVFVNNSGFDYNAIVVVDSGAGVAVNDNIFRVATTGILLQSGSSGVEVGYNNFGTVTTDISDSGTGNIVTESTQAVKGGKSYPDGTIEKWDSTSVTLNASGDGSITFDNAFPNAFFTAIICNGDVGVEATSNFIVNQGTSSTTGINFSVRPNPGAIQVRANWIAKGN